MMLFNRSDHPHRRFNPLTGDWVLNSPQRNQRPWLGKQEPVSQKVIPAYDSGCYLCPGNLRANGQRNPEYQTTYLFENDFSALLDQEYEPIPHSHPLFQITVPRGLCRVICFSPRHDLSLPELEVAAIKTVLELWSAQVSELGKRFRWVQIFENKGELMGCSNPHPHCQIWAMDYLPNEPAREDRNQLAHFLRYGSPLLTEYAKLEGDAGERVIVENKHWLAVVPFWAIWPYEALLLPKRHVLRLPDLDRAEVTALAELLKRLLSRYDNLFQVSFPYSMGWHGAPTDQADYRHWQLHAHLYPPLLRSASIRKFMVGFETLAEPQRDLTAEQAAASLRSLPDTHFKLNC